MRIMGRGEIVRLLQQHAAEIEVTDGSVWLTQDGDVEDHIITKGNSFRISRPGVTVLSALKPAVVEIRPPAEATGWLLATAA